MKALYKANATRRKRARKVELVRLMNRWMVRLLFVAVVAGVMGSAIWNNIATNRLIEQATGTDPNRQVSALKQIATRDDFYDLLQSRRPPARLRVAEGVERMNDPDGVKIALAMLRDPDPKVRDRFLSALETIGRNNLEALAEGLKHSDGKVKNGTVAVMTQIGSTCLPVALKAFEDSGARAAATEVLVQFGTLSVPGLLDILSKAEETALQLDTITALGRIGDRRATDAILPFLKTVSRQDRRVVLVALGSIADPRTEDLLIQALQSNQEDPDARAQVALGLGRIGTPRTFQALAQALSDPNLLVADSAAESLKLAGAPALGTLAESLRHPNPAVRRRAVVALGGVADARAVQLLTQALRDPEPEVRRASATALGEVQRPEAVPVLVGALRSADGGVVQNAIQSLVRIGKPAIEPLARLLSDPDEQVAYASASALSAIPEAEPTLLRLAEQPPTQKFALIALLERGSPTARPLFERVAQSPDPSLRQLAQEALLQLRP
ncbi:MAG: HEAT repeat domain-containing protein [Fimbriimonadales bacterium]